MSEVTLRIGGKAYKVACADGQEAQLAKLGSMIDAKFKQMEGNLAPSEAENLLFAGILLADELNEAREAAGDDPAELADKVKLAMQASDTAETKSRELSLELDAVRAERDAIANDLANIKSAASGQEPLFAAEDFAPKLEQLADTLEKCVDSLEGKVPAP
uniref:cell division protein ZapA n=1 Tax=uncultured Altererythrobacter sp. TaxID=500840 RepID=UPI00261BFF02|nr:cell division protein ZapA [uncultured Altererythrobacter sp.]